MDLIGTSRLHYKIIEKLGEGGMGVVYKALDTKLKREVAIKFLPWSIASNADMRMRFQIEAQAVATLNHPNIATIYAIEELKGPDNQDEIFFVMEYINGMELKQKLKEGTLTLAEKVNIALQVADGLQAAHEKGITHRDIKPANIMITERDRVKLMDFGLAKIGKGVQLTKTNTTLGTIAYMSPEQAQGIPVDHRSDIWSFGVVLYEMFTGSLPYQADHEHALIYAIINLEPRPISSQSDEVPKPLISIVDQTLKKDPEERYQDIHILTEDLHHYADTLFSTIRTGAKNSASSGTINLRTPPVPARKPSKKPASAHAMTAVRDLKPGKLNLALIGLMTFIFSGVAVWWIITGVVLPGKESGAELASNDSIHAIPPPVLTEDTLPAPFEIEIADDATQQGETEDTLDAAEPAGIPQTPDPPPVNEPNPTTSTASSNATVDDPVDSDETERLENLRSAAIDTRSSMIQAEAGVSGSDTFKNQLPSYTAAQQSRRDGEIQFNASNFQESAVLFERARLAFVAAQQEAVSRLRMQADASKASMNQVKSGITEQNPEAAEYSRALSSQEAADRAYSDNDYERAAALYDEAAQFFDTVAKKIAGEADLMKKLEASVDEARDKIKDAFENRNISELESIVVLSESDKETWRTVFSSFRNFRLTFGGEELSRLAEDRYQLGLPSSLTYTNNKNEEATTRFVLTGTLTYANERWSSSRFDMRFYDR